MQHESYNYNNFIISFAKYFCNILRSEIKTTISCQQKNKVVKFFFLYLFMVFVLKSTEISTESPLYHKVPSYRHLTYLHF
jgi:hypothetical protein